MKKASIMLLVILCIGLLSSCSSYEANDINDTKTAHSNFIGAIIEINDNYAIVSAKIFEGNPEGDVIVDLSVNKDDTFQVGDQVIVEFDGTVMESNPAQINTLSVELAD